MWILGWHQAQPFYLRPVKSVFCNIPHFGKFNGFNQSEFLISYGALSTNNFLPRQQARSSTHVILAKTNLSQEFCTHCMSRLLCNLCTCPLEMRYQSQCDFLKNNRHCHRLLIPFVSQEKGRLLITHWRSGVIRPIKAIYLRLLRTWTSWKLDRPPYSTHVGSALRTWHLTLIMTTRVSEGDTTQFPELLMNFTFLYVHKDEGS